MTILAAAQLQRYLYLTVDAVPQILRGPDYHTGNCEVVLLLTSEQVRAGMAEAMLGAGCLGGAGAALGTLRGDGHGIARVRAAHAPAAVVLVGGSDEGVLYSAYAFAERALGVRFYLSGDVVPDRTVPGRVPAGSLEALLARAGGGDGVELLSAAPMFETRGLQPFHDFPEGPDWWDADYYTFILDQVRALQ